MLNNLSIMGRITRDLELKATTNNISVVSFSIATQRNFKQGEEYPTDFFNVVAWRKTAELIAKHFQKGSMIAIKGSLQSRKYTDKDGNNRTVVEILADSVYFCESKKQAEGNGENSYAPSPTAPPMAAGNAQNYTIVPDFGDAPDDDDYPF